MKKQIPWGKHLSLGAMVLLSGGLVATMYMQNKRMSHLEMNQNKTLDFTKIDKALSSPEFREYSLNQAVPLGADAKMFRFVLLNKESGQPLLYNMDSSISYVNVKGLDDSVEKFYPMNGSNSIGYLDILINKKEQPELFDKCKVGSTFGFEGPHPTNYQLYASNQEQTQVISLIAQDIENGIAPSLQVIYDMVILDDRLEKPKKNNLKHIHLFYVVSKRQDYLLRQSLEGISQRYGNQVTVTIVPRSETLFDKGTVDTLKENATQGPVIVCGSREFESDISKHLRDTHNIPSILINQ